MTWKDRVTAIAGMAIIAFVILFQTIHRLPVPGAKTPSFPAKVVRFGGIPSKWQADKIIVIASTTDGRTGQGVLSQQRAQELGCKLGSPVDAHLEGSLMVVDALTCGQRSATLPR